MKTTITIEDIKTSEGNDGINYRIEFEPELTDQNTPALELSQIVLDCIDQQIMPRGVTKH